MPEMNFSAICCWLQGPCWNSGMQNEHRSIHMSNFFKKENLTITAHSEVKNILKMSCRDTFDCVVRVPQWKWQGHNMVAQGGVEKKLEDRAGDCPSEHLPVHNQKCLFTL